MSGEHPRPPGRLCLWMLETASWLARPAHRERWLEEWQAETWQASCDERRGARWRLLLRVGGCYLDALTTWSLPLSILPSSAAEAPRFSQRRGGSETMWQDLRFALRTLRNNKLFAVVAALTLALGIGANSTIFSAIDAVLLRPLPLPDPDRVVIVWGFHPEIGRETASLPDFVDWREQSSSFEGLAAYVRQSQTLTGREQAERLSGARVTRGFFEVLGAEMVVGRSFLAEEDRAEAEGVVILSYGLWQSRFGGERPIVGRKLTLGGQPYTVVGVTAPGFDFPRGTELWRPLALDPQQAGRRSDFLTVIGRLEGGSTVEGSQEELRTIMARLEQQYPNSNARWTVDVLPLHEQLVGEARPALLVLLAAVGVLLLIACANVTNLILARASSRGGELSVRTALGAGRWRLFRQLLLESLLLAGLGGLLGVALAAIGIRVLRAFGPADVPRLETLALDLNVLGFCLLVTLGTGLLCGALPALRMSSAALSRSLAGLRGGSPDRSRLRTALVGAQMTLAVMLLIAAGLLLRSFWRLQQIDTGFRVERLVTARVSLPSSDYPEDHQVGAFYRESAARIAALPGVESVGAIDGVPIRDGANYLTFLVEGRPPPDSGTVQDAEVLSVMPGYFDAVGIPLRRGRLLEERDDAEGELVVVINERLAEQYFPEQEALDQQLNLGAPEGPWSRVVGVVGDTRHSELTDRPYPQIYFPLGQRPRRSMSFVVRTSGPPEDLVPSLRQVIGERDAQLPLFAIGTFRQIVAEALAQPRFNLQLLGAFALCALLLAGIGLYGILSYSIAQRRRELGLRMALGASGRRLVAEVARQGLVVVIAGLAVGVVGALLLGRWLSGLLFGVAPTDLGAYLLTVPVLLLVALLASWLPARRASRVDPAIALREQ